TTWMRPRQWMALSSSLASRPPTRSIRRRFEMRSRRLMSRPSTARSSSPRQDKSTRSSHQSFSFRAGSRSCSGLPPSSRAICASKSPDSGWRCGSDRRAIHPAGPAQLWGSGTSVMIYLQIAANGLVLGGLYACIAVGFSLVWGVLNVINILHGTFIVLGSYIAYFAYVHAGIHPFASIVIAGGVLYALGHAIHAGIINRVIAAPVLITLTLTFGLDLILNNAMLVAFTADYRSINLARPLGTLEIGPVFLPGDRVAAM